jgi:hypothetical protein
MIPALADIAASAATKKRRKIDFIGVLHFREE